MRIIRPNVITLPDFVTACNVQEVCYPAWSAAVTYLIGDRRVSSGVIYECIVSNINCTPASYLTGSTPKWRIIGNSYTTWSAATTYAAGDRAVEGVIVYESIAGANLNNAPSLTSTGLTPKWLVVGYDNKYAMFDAVVGSQTIGSSETNTGNITLTITPGLCDSVALLDLNATQVIIEPVTGLIDGQPFSQTIDLVSKSGVSDMYKYFFDPIILAKVVVLNLPVANVAWNITISNGGQVSKIGTCVLGTAYDLGGTQYSPQIGITDYSKKEVDVYGNWSVTQRSYSKRMSCETLFENTEIDAIHQILSEYRATPVVWIGASGYAAMVIYGFFKSFSITIPYVNNSTCSIEIEGLT